MASQKSSNSLLRHISVLVILSILLRFRHNVPQQPKLSITSPIRVNKPVQTVARTKTDNPISLRLHEKYPQWIPIKWFQREPVPPFETPKKDRDIRQEHNVPSIFNPTVVFVDGTFLAIGRSFIEPQSIRNVNTTTTSVLWTCFAVRDFA
jgi:hypothetical protein